MGSKANEEVVTVSPAVDENVPSEIVREDLILAKQAAEKEHELGLCDAIPRYPRAVVKHHGGYDIVLISSFNAQPSFVRRYGAYVPNTDSYQIKVALQDGLANAVSIGTVIGAFANGYFVHNFGYRKALLGSFVAIWAFIFISFFAKDLANILIGELLCGIP
ncbi:general substrate transporter [Penicillium canescens]|nr:general substrate transporter [Penicillium canescens]